MIKQFKDNSNNWWLNGKHFTVCQGNPCLVAGGIPTKEEIEQLKRYFKRKNI